MPERSLEVVLSVLGVGLISVVGATVLLSRGRVAKILPLLVALAAGALIGDTFLHLLPDAVAEAGGFTPAIAWGVLAGLVGFFLVESVLHWHHHGEDVHEHTEEGIHQLGWMNLIADGLHNFIDGMLIAAAWIVSPEAGWATTIAVALHEIPQEFGDFGVLLHAGFTPRRAILFNVLSGLAAVVGALVVLAAGEVGLAQSLVPVAAGGFLYIACADLVPEMRKRARGLALLTTSIALAVGLGLMAVVHELIPCGHAHHGHGHVHGAGAEGGHGHAHDGDQDEGEDHGHDHDGDHDGDQDGDHDGDHGHDHDDGK
jgi:zinc and cadmium transporter